MQKLRPRSPYEKLGGYVHLPRLIDKARLYRKGLLNGYNYKTVGFDKHLLAFLKLDGDKFEEIANHFDDDQEVLSQPWFSNRDRYPATVIEHVLYDAAKQRGDDETVAMLNRAIDQLIEQSEDADAAD